MYRLLMAHDNECGIGMHDGTMPWTGTLAARIDMKTFQLKTTGNVIIMGRKTRDAIGRVLPNRLNVVLSRAYPDVPTMIDGFLCTSSIYKLHDYLVENHADVKQWFVIGGADLVRSYLAANFISSYDITHIIGDFNCDIKMDELKSLPELQRGWEDDYLDLAREALQAPPIPNRTGMRARAIFNKSISCDLRKEFPMLTTRKPYIGMVFKELKWMMEGNTWSQPLEAQKINVWKHNTQAKYTAPIGLREGELGATYGWNWRRWGAYYPVTRERRAFYVTVVALLLLRQWGLLLALCAACAYLSRGTDQLMNVLHQLRYDPTSRRIIMDVWNPQQIDRAALPPCAVLWQWNVEYNDNQRILHCVVTQRSSDLFAALSWNHCAASLLTIMLADQAGMVPGIVTINIGNLHVYENQVDVLTTQLSRKRFNGTKWTLHPNTRTLLSYQLEDFAFQNVSWGKLTAPLS